MLRSASTLLLVLLFSLPASAQNLAPLQRWFYGLPLGSPGIKRSLQADSRFVQRVVSGDDCWANYMGAIRREALFPISKGIDSAIILASCRWLRSPGDSLHTSHYNGPLVDLQITYFSSDSAVLHGLFGEILADFAYLGKDVVRQPITGLETGGEQQLNGFSFSIIDTKRKWQAATVYGNRNRERIKSLTVTFEYSVHDN